MEHYKQEIDLTYSLFDLQEIMAFQLAHDVQILREADWQYMCYIDKIGYGNALTFMGALVIGIKQYKNKKD